DLLGPLAPDGCEQRLLVLATFDETLGLEPLQHLAGRRARDAEHLGDPRRERRQSGVDRPVLADRKRQEVDRLEVLVDGMTGHGRILTVACRDLSPVTLTAFVR